LENTIACCLQCLKSLALISNPIIPHASEELWKMLGYQKTLQELGWDMIAQNMIPAGQKLLEPKILFQKVEDEQIEQEIAKLKVMSKASAKPAATKEQIEIKDFQKIDLRVGQILQAVPVPKSKKLLKVEVDLGAEKRTIVSGIALSYKPEELIGKKVVVVANLKPAQLMGVESHGMILAGNDGDILEVLAVQHLPPGSTVF
jgi:methionyl-tRNA synthetase